MAALASANPPGPLTAPASRETTSVNSSDAHARSVPHGSLPAETPSHVPSSFVREVGIYVGRIREFRRPDWVMYLAWVGLMFSLVFATGGFLTAGTVFGTSFPAAAWMVPIGALIFSISIAIDTIGHLTIYKEEISRAEGLVHSITIFCGIGSCVLLTAAYDYPAALWIPAMVLTILSFVYSLIDEAFHWRRYVQEHADRVEMWSHVGIFVGHGIMMIGWWVWFFGGYEGVASALQAFAG